MCKSLLPIKLQSTPSHPGPVATQRHGDNHHQYHRAPTLLENGAVLLVVVEAAVGVLLPPVPHASWHLDLLQESLRSLDGQQGIGAFV